MHPTAAAWRGRGRIVPGPEGDVFVVDQAPSTVEHEPPVLFVHGFPTCSYDWHHTFDRLDTRRLIALDLPGYGLSAKPNRTIGVEAMADTVVAVGEMLGLETVDLVGHDMGDTVVGAVLARDLDAGLPFAVNRTVITNGSVYIRMADLRWQQRLLLRLPARSLPFGLPGAMYRRGIAALFGETPAPRGELDAMWDLFRTADGDRRIPRLIRYLMERHAHEDRWTGALVRHPAPLEIIWGTADPVAVSPIGERLAGARGTAVTWLDGVGHFPMVERPDDFVAALRSALDVPRTGEAPTDG